MGRALLRAFALCAFALCAFALCAFAVASPAEAGRRRGDGSGSIILLAPEELTVLQRDALDQATVAVSGGCSGDPGVIRASFAGQTYDLDTDPRCTLGRGFDGVVTLQGPAQGPLRVFASENPAVFDEREIGVGDVFVIAGQSNAVGFAPTPNVFFHETLTAAAFSRIPDQEWLPADDPFHNTGLDLGSAWPHLATILMADENAAVPVGFIATAVGGASLVPSDGVCWDPDPTSGCTLYGDLLAQVRASGAGGASAVLYFQGETDAQLGVSQADYREALERLGARVAADLGVPLVLGQIGQFRIVPESDLEAIRNAQLAAALDSGNNVFGGFATADLPVWDNVHFHDAGVVGLAERFCAEIDVLLHGGSFASCALADFLP